MKKICIIIVYFGKLPNYFQMWLETCKFNESIDFLIITDDKNSFCYPNNVNVVYESFEEVKNRFQKIFNFKIALESPYKLCDYKPAYGEAFADYLKDYDFWGHCDIDLFFGDIRKFITDDILDSNERILTRGHFSLYKNTSEINIKYRTSLIEGCQNYIDVYTTNDSCCYDEWGGHCGNGISEIFKRLGIKQYDELIYADLSFLKYQFKLAQDMSDECTNRIFMFDKGKLYSYSLKDKNVVKKEYMYCHFQKRNPNINITKDFDKFYFLPPNEFKKLNEIDINSKTLKRLTRINKIYTGPIIFRIKQIKNTIKKFLNKNMFNN